MRTVHYFPLSDTEVINAIKQSDQPTPYPADLQQATRGKYIAAIGRYSNGVMQIVTADGSDTSMSAQLDEAGFGSGGVM